MAHFAEIDNNNIVLRVIVVSDDHEADGENWCHGLLGGRWKQTSYNHRIRKQYAGIGFKYDATADVFVQPQPFPSWTLSETHDWLPPTPRPVDGKFYMWVEETLEWQQLDDSV